MVWDCGESVQTEKAKKVGGEGFICEQSLSTASPPANQIPGLKLRIQQRHPIKHLRSCDPTLRCSRGSPEGQRPSSTSRLPWGGRTDLTPPPSSFPALDPDLGTNRTLDQPSKPFSIYVLKPQVFKIHFQYFFFKCLI